MSFEDLQVRTVSVLDLTLDPENARLHGEENLAAIRGSLKRFGQVKPIVVDARNRVLAGNGMLTAAKQLGWSSVEVVCAPADWSADRAMAYALADNRTAELAEWDDRILADQLVELDANGWDVAALGFPSLMPPTDPGPSVDHPLDAERLLRCPACGFQWQDVRKDQA